MKQTRTHSLSNNGQVILYQVKFLVWTHSLSRPFSSPRHLAMEYQDIKAREGNLTRGSRIISFKKAISASTSHRGSLCALVTKSFLAIILHKQL